MRRRVRVARPKLLLVIAAAVSAHRGGLERGSGTFFHRLASLEMAPPTGQAGKKQHVSLACAASSSDLSSASAAATARASGRFASRFRAASARDASSTVPSLSGEERRYYPDTHFIPHNNITVLGGFLCKLLEFTFSFTPSP